MAFILFQNYFLFFEIIDNNQGDGDILLYHFDLYQDISTNTHEINFILNLEWVNAIQ